MKEVRTVVESLGKAVHSEEEPITLKTKIRKQKKDDTEKRRQKVAKLFFKGFTKDEIVTQLGVTSQAVEKDLRAIRRHLSPKEIKSLNYLRNRSVSGLRQVQSVAWEIIDEFVKNPGVRLNALGKFIQAEELVTKVQGISGEKVTVPTENIASRLLKELREIEEKAKIESNGHKELGSAIS